jgi:hypothetical protein
MVLAMPETDKAEPWNPARVRCFTDDRVEVAAAASSSSSNDDDSRPCTPAELAKSEAEYVRDATAKAAAKAKENADMAKVFGLPGLDDNSARAFAEKLRKYAGWRSVTYRGKGVFDVDYHFTGRASQDFLFPALPDNALIIPFIALRRRADGSVLVTAPAMTGKGGMLGAPGSSGGSPVEGPTARAEGRLIVTTDGEILTNNSEDGAQISSNGRQLHWDVTPSSTKVPETLIRL